MFATTWRVLYKDKARDDGRTSLKRNSYRKEVGAGAANSRIVFRTRNFSGSLEYSSFLSLNISFVKSWIVALCNLK